MKITITQLYYLSMQAHHIPMELLTSLWFPLSYVAEHRMPSHLSLDRWYLLYYLKKKGVKLQHVHSHANVLPIGSDMVRVEA